MFSAVLGQSESGNAELKALHQEIDKLGDMVAKLKAEQTRSNDLQAELKTPVTGFSRRDSLRLINLKRKQAASSARIDQLTLEIIKISKQLEDPGKRYALAKKLREPKSSKQQSTPQPVADSTNTPQVISARSIDLAAVKMVRKGKSLDQARLLTIEGLSEQQVLQFYQSLEKKDRYELYDIADEIVASEDTDLVDARRSAIYFYLFTK